jgi:serine/threonine protein kinase
MDEELSREHSPQQGGSVIDHHIDQTHIDSISSSDQPAFIQGSILSMIKTGQELPGRYQIAHPLGKGGYGAVFAGTDLNLDRPIAIKLFIQEIESQAAKRFKDEGRLIAKLQHPHIIQVYAFNEIDFLCPFLVMEQFGTGSLRDHWPSGDHPNLVEAINIIAQLLDALNAAHQVGVVHRDIKEANILYDRQTQRIKLCDFGIARAVERLQDQAQTTREGCIIGTGHYIAPERYLGQNHDPRSDLYSVGVLFYRLLVGHRPHEQFYGEPLQPATIMFRITSEPIARLTQIPRAIERVCLRLLERDITLRYQNADQARQDLLEAFMSPETESCEYDVPDLLSMSIAALDAPQSKSSSSDIIRQRPLQPPEPYQADESTSNIAHQVHESTQSLSMKREVITNKRSIFYPIIAFFMGITIFIFAWYIGLFSAQNHQPTIIHLGAPKSLTSQTSPTNRPTLIDSKDHGVTPLHKDHHLPKVKETSAPGIKRRSTQRKRDQQTTPRRPKKTSKTSSPYIFPVEDVR